MSRRLFIHATNVHQGGGKTLLAALLGECRGSDEIVAILDSRMTLSDNVPANLTIKTVKPTILQRIRADRWLVKTVALDDIVLCFGNVPPLFKLRGHVMVFVQNRYLIDYVKLNEFSLKTRLRLAVERMWLMARISNVDEFIVQTPTMRMLLEARIKRKIPIYVLPFMAHSDGYRRETQSSKLQNGKAFTFLYVASGEPHKNHEQLIEAWCLLVSEGIFPSLKLTLDRERFKELWFWIDQKIKQHQLKVDNLGSVPSENMKSLYSSVDALIYPSTFESFGLPLIEAIQTGLSVLAAELDYVRDVLDPDQTFDPESPISIARAVKRFMGIKELPLPMRDAAGFLQHILTRSK